MSQKFIIIELSEDGQWTVATPTLFSSSLQARICADRIPAHRMPQVVAVPAGTYSTSQVGGAVI
jgi:hypothetical protein